ncbi:hypothetical protein FRB94_012383 [Tulasnella sp. JGI-2019a]|nr:hypothetical protein FRB93_008529 [Tulasnella sp. JGI-2019a]KAG8991595.1 hypothetical protein FRB94_012383 [Tulasnella sp. JGI-2019a]
MKLISSAPMMMMIVIIDAMRGPNGELIMPMNPAVSIPILEPDHTHSVSCVPEDHSRLCMHILVDKLRSPNILSLVSRSDKGDLKFNTSIRKGNRSSLGQGRVGSLMDRRQRC